MQPSSRKRLTRTEQKLRTRDRILAAAARVIGRRGLGDASVDEISEDAGYSTGAFYANFASKDEVFAAALGFQADEMRRTAGATADLRGDVEWLAGLEDWRILFWLEIVAHGGRSPKLRREVAAYLEAARARIAGQLGTATDDDAATVILAAEIGLAVQRLFGHDRLDGDVLTDLAEASRRPRRRRR